MFPFQIRTSRVALRDFVKDDWGNFLEWAADESIYTYMAFRFDSVEDATAEVERLLNHPSRITHARRHYCIAVLDATDGSETFADISGFDLHQHGSGEVGWYLSSRHWNKGLATEATSLLLHLGFDLLGLPMLKATCDLSVRAEQVRQVDRDLRGCGVPRFQPPE